MLPSSELRGRYARGHLVLDQGGQLAWTRNVGIQPTVYLQDSAAPCTLADLARTVYHSGAPPQPVLVCGVPDPQMVWDLFPGSICGTSIRDARGQWTVWAMPSERAATLLRLVEIAAATRLPRVFLTVWVRPGSVTPAPPHQGAYLELGFA